MRNNSKLIIEDNVKLYPGSVINISNDSMAYIGCGVCGRMVVTVYDKSVVYLGEKSTVGNGVFVGTSDAFCYIGKDCMISTDVALQVRDGHNIFDLEKNENINSKKKF